MRVTNEVKALVKATIENCIVTANKHYGRTFNYPTVKYDKRGTTAGTATDHTYTINLNSVLLMENVQHFMSGIVVHEFAHLVDGIVNPHTRSGWGKRSLHGPTWKTIMRLLGGPTDRCHSYDTTNSRVKKRGQVKHIWTCSCGNPLGTMTLGAKRHNNMTNKFSRARYWMRGHANHTYTYVGIEGATPAPVVQPLPKAAEAPKRCYNKPTKLSRCRRVYDREMSKKDTIIAFIGEGCTPAGASTYYYKILKEF